MREWQVENHVFLRASMHTTLKLALQLIHLVVEVLYLRMITVTLCV